MKKTIMIGVALLSSAAVYAQSVLDHFNIGPYEVDYMGQGDVKYRLADNLDLYEYFELSRDTTISVVEPVKTLNHAWEVSFKAGADTKNRKEFGLEGVWKKKVAPVLYFDAGLSLTIDNMPATDKKKRTMLEVGVPLKVEWGKISYQKSSLYASVGIVPAVYTTASTKILKLVVETETAKPAPTPDSGASGAVAATTPTKAGAGSDAQTPSTGGAASAGDKVTYKERWVKGPYSKTGFLIAPVVEFGGNVPVGDAIMRIGVYGIYKINCTPSNYNVYRLEAGTGFIGARIGVMF